MTKTQNTPFGLAHLPVVKDREKAYPFTNIQKMGGTLLALLGSDSPDGKNAVVIKLWDLETVTEEQLDEIEQYLKPKFN